ncbi:MAG: 50S ribosomal protein L13 [Candidatus Gracilibacteria bacterium]
MNSKTYSPKLEEINKNRKWFLIDAEGKTLGKLATKIAVILRGKHKPCFSPHLDCGDHVIIINAEKIKLTGNKLEQKTYFKHTEWMGHYTLTSAKKMLAEKPTKVISEAILGMIPRTRLRNHIMSKLHIYAGPTHGQAAQNPETITL